MTRRAKSLPKPSAEEREAARLAAAAMRRAIADPDTMGARTVMFVDYSRPRRGERLVTWANLPGFKKVNGSYQHDCLPGWTYTKAEIVPELIPDLEALAERGERPTVETARQR